ncbi:hypothetical protein [Breoghania sp. L-A4]|uniref:hypothetical protein n=1 Tax=Breoghania sp. L-A4 TaxID=2304600 RepID=UPI0020BD7EFF|nr:hypothetical protein [Breoghania sp. L-A4]
MDHATGDYVITIGDDDSVLPGQYPALKTLLEREKPEAVSWQSNFYNWPNAYNPNAGRLKIKKSGVFGRPITVATRDLLDDPQWGLTHSNDITPRLHHGLISRVALDKLRAKTGHIHGSGAVDVYFSSAILSVIDSFIYLRHPFSMLAMGPAAAG